MSFFLSPSLTIQLREDIFQHSLTDSEIRRIPSMGGHHIARKSTSVNEQDLSWLFTIIIDNIEYVMYTERFTRGQGELASLRKKVERQLEEKAAKHQTVLDYLKDK